MENGIYRNSKCDHDMLTSCVAILHKVILIMKTFTYNPNILTFDSTITDNSFVQMLT